MLYSRLFIACISFMATLNAATPLQEEEYDAIVVGAGVAGLSAANTLQENGVKRVLVLEAANRIGGRIWTNDSWGSKMELGASWIHGIENSPLYDVVSGMNLTIQPTIYNNASLDAKLNSMALYNQDGKKLSVQAVKALQDQVDEFEKYLDEINSHGREHSFTYIDALNGFAKKYNLTKDDYDRLYFVLRLLNTYEIAVDLEDMCVNVEELYKQSQVSGTNGIIPLGYNLVTAKLAKNLAIELNCKVDKIDYSDDTVLVDSSKGQFRAKNCIVTVPLGVLKNNEIAFTPTLPKEKQDVIEHIQVGTFNKIYLFFPTMFWDKNVEWIECIPPADAKDAIFDIMNFGKYFHQPILLVFTAGSFAKEVENWSDKTTVETIMNTLKKIYGPNVPEPSSYLITRWGKDPLFYGSYSSPGLKADNSTYLAFATPVNNRLFFAGEATSQTDCSTVLGGFTSGQRAAKQILDKVKANKES
jgi:monoamine oxidase